MSEPPSKQAIQALAEQVVYLRREMIDLMAGQLALMEYVCAMAEKTCGVSGTAAKDYVMGNTEKHRQSILARVEDIDPALAAFLDVRSQQDVEEGLNGE